MKKILTTSLLLVFPFLQADITREECLANTNCTITEQTTTVETEVTSGNLVPELKDWQMSGDATVTGGNYNYCQTGEACTGSQGGTFSTEIDFSNEMTKAEINAGFNFNYGVTVNSHSSNATLPLCADTTGDCKDTVKINVVLTENSIEIGESFSHEFVLDYKDQYNYQFSQAIGVNNYEQLSAWLSLYGIDSGYPSGMWGPQFIDPYLTLNYTSIEYITNEIYNVIESVIDDDQTDLIVDIITQDTETNEWVLVDTISEEEEAARLEEERLAQEEADRIAEEERLLEEARLAELERLRLLEETRLAEIERLRLLAEEEARLAEEARIAAELLAEQEAEEEREATVVTIAASETEIQFEDTSDDMFTETVEVAFTGGPEVSVDFADTTDTFSSAVLETAIDMPPPMEHSGGFDQMPEPEISMEMAPPDMGFSSFDEPVSEVPLDMPVDAPEMPSIESIEMEVEPTIAPVVEAPREAPVAPESTPEPEAPRVVENTPEPEPEASPEPSSNPEPREEPKTEVASASEPEEKPVAVKVKPKESKKERVARKVADRVMTTLAQTYNITMQNVALSVMGRQTDITSYNQQMLDASSWYPDMQLEGGTNYDHPSQIYIQAAANQDMAELEAIQWR